MNPRREYKRYSLALVNPPFKYICRKTVDWDACRVEADGEELLFEWDAATSAFDESRDVLASRPGAHGRLRKMAERYLADSLAFKRQFAPQPY